MNFNPPKLDRLEELRRFRLQLEGLRSWPLDDVRMEMERWVSRKIRALEAQ